MLVFLHNPLLKPSSINSHSKSPLVDEKIVSGNDKTRSINIFFINFPRVPYSFIAMCKGDQKTHEHYCLLSYEHKEIGVFMKSLKYYVAVLCIGFLSTAYSLVMPVLISIVNPVN